MADGIFYRDTRDPLIVADETAITLVATQKALWPYARTILPANYWRVGKTVKITAFGKLTTGATPGNLTPAIGYGSADAPAVSFAGVARALVAGVTNISWLAEFYATCRSIGATGTLVAWGKFIIDLAGQLSTAQPNLIPGSTLTAATIDTTVGTNSLVLTAARSGSTVETMATQGLIVEALN